MAGSSTGMGSPARCGLGAAGNMNPPFGGFALGWLANSITPAEGKWFFRDATANFRQAKSASYKLVLDCNGFVLIQQVEHDY